jgi:hypothetical protein
MHASGVDVLGAIDQSQVVVGENALRDSARVGDAKS